MKPYTIILIVILMVSSSSCTNSKNKIKTGNDHISKIEMEKGERIYRAKCMNCHRKDGKGHIGTYPPLANSDFLKKKLGKAIQMVKYGNNDPIKVNGVKYQAYMPASGLNDQDIQLVINYILNSWGNQMGSVDLETIKSIKEKR